MTAVRNLTIGALKRFPLPAIGEGVDKDGRGHVLAFAASEMVPGASLLVGEAALRAGAGKVQLAVPPRLALATGLAFPECAVLPLAPGGTLNRAVSAALRAAGCILIGPGMADSGATLRLVLACLRKTGDPSFVLDAAALHELWRHASGIKRLRRRIVLTPHHGELATLLGVPKADVDADPLGCAATAARGLGATVVLKDEITHLVSPAGVAWRFQGGVPGLATGGSGDVLAGVLAGLIARGADPVTAALWSIVIHAEVGKHLSRSFGKVGFIARDFLKEIPRVLSCLSAR